jgi:hypothetical protein
VGGRGTVSPRMVSTHWQPYASGGMRLRLHINPLASPYAHEASGAPDLWAEFLLDYQSGDSQIELLKHQWDVLMFADWLAEDGAKIATVTLPEEPRGDESLAEALDRMGERDHESFPDEAEADDWFERLYLFRRTHLVSFALRGAKVPEVVFGVRDGVGEVSRCRGERWCYRFEFDDFVADIVRTLNETAEAAELESRSRLESKLTVFRAKVAAGCTRLV